MPHLISLTSSPIAIPETIQLKTNSTGCILLENRSKNFTSSCPIPNSYQIKKQLGSKRTGAQSRAEYRMQINGNVVNTNKALQCWEAPCRGRAAGQPVPNRARARRGHRNGTGHFQHTAAPLGAPSTTIHTHTRPKPASRTARGKTWTWGLYYEPPLRSECLANPAPAYWLQ